MLRRHLVNCHCKSPVFRMRQEILVRFGSGSALLRYVSERRLRPGQPSVAGWTLDERRQPPRKASPRRSATGPHVVIPKFIRQLIEIAQNIPDMRAAMAVLDEENKSKVRGVIKITKNMLDDLDDWSRHQYTPKQNVLWLSRPTFSAVLKYRLLTLYLATTIKI